MTTRASSRYRHLALVSLLFVGLALCGCAGVHSGAQKFGEGLGNMGDKALEAIGFKKHDVPPALELPEAAKPPRLMTLKLAASDSLNVDAAGKALSLVVRIYKLRGATAFLNASPETFGNGSREKEALADELIESRELVLLPGQQKIVSERWAREATHVGIVALFRAPAPQRWRYAFELDPLPRGEGLVIGAHACALSVAAGQAVGTADNIMKLPSSTCPFD